MSNAWAASSSAKAFDSIYSFLYQFNGWEWWGDIQIDIQRDLSKPDKYY